LLSRRREVRAQVCVIVVAHYTGTLRSTSKSATATSGAAFGCSHEGFRPSHHSGAVGVQDELFLTGSQNRSHRPLGCEVEVCDSLDRSDKGVLISALAHKSKSRELQSSSPLPDFSLVYSRHRRKPWPCISAAGRGEVRQPKVRIVTAMLACAFLASLKYPSKFPRPFKFPILSNTGQRAGAIENCLCLGLS
jgi:hypothetical protein